MPGIQREQLFPYREAFQSGLSFSLPFAGIQIQREDTGPAQACSPQSPSPRRSRRKIKSVCSSDKKFPFFTEMAVSLSRPFPYSIPDPMAIFELSCWTFRSAYFPGLTKARIRFTWYPVRNGTAPRSARKYREGRAQGSRRRQRRRSICS